MGMMPAVGKDTVAVLGDLVAAADAAVDSAARDMEPGREIWSKAVFLLTVR